MQTREGPQSPVGRGRWGGALLQAGFEPAIYAMTVNIGNHYATLPPIPFSPAQRCNNRYQPMKTEQIGGLRGTLDLLVHAPKRSVGKVEWPGAGSAFCAGLPAVSRLSTGHQMSPAHRHFWSTHSFHHCRSCCIASCVALAPLGAKYQESGQKRLICIYWGFVP